MPLAPRVRLNWDGPEHYDPTQKVPCRACETVTNMRDRNGRACCQTCAEREIAAELADLTGGRVPAELYARTPQP
ncbi:hypothetical protein [Micromonospora sp. NPDC049662]|uniref:hypothetical protein n=1 Tax=Micromonospora sp. NPDC049662 TaxID=3155397 RepID=UPI003422F519